MYQNNDYEAIRVAIRTCTKIDFKKARVARIRDTLLLSELEISTSLIPDIRDNLNVQIISDPYFWDFDEEGYLVDFE